MDGLGCEAYLSGALCGYPLLTHFGGTSTGMSASETRGGQAEQQAWVRNRRYVAGTDRSACRCEIGYRRLSSTLVAVGSAKREEGSIPRRFVNRPGDHRVGDQSRTIGFQLSIPFVDLLDTIGVEQQRCRRTYLTNMALKGGSDAPT
jgi:hypothetical protein